MSTTEESIVCDVKNCEIDSQNLIETNNNIDPNLVNEKCLKTKEKKLDNEEPESNLEKDDYLSSSNDSLNFVKVVHNARSYDEPKNLTETLEDARWMMKEFLNGKFQLIMERCKKRSHVSFFHEAGSAIFDFLDAFLAFEKDKFNLALISMRKASERANSYRKKTGLVGYLVRGDFSQHTDLELHAELMFAVTELMTGLLQMLADQSIYGAINACIKAKTAYSALKNCEYALQDKLEWESELSKQNLESGTCLGIGAFDLILSFCPSTITRILDYVGFNSDRLNALDLLQRSIDQEEAIYYEVCTVVKIAYHAFLSYFYGIGELNKSFFKRCTQKWATSQTNAEFLSVCKGSRDLVHGKPISAIKYFKQCLVNQTAYPQLNYICYWQMTWAYVMQCDWEEAVHYTGLLKDKCNWSRAMFTYLHAIFLYQHQEKNKITGLEPKISETLCMVPKLKRNLGGKKAFHEKIVLDRSKKYNNKVNEMLLPALELIYIWNVFNMMSNDPKLLENYLELIEEKLKIHVKTPERTPLDKYCYLMFMKGVILRHLNKTDAAVDHFNQVLSCKSRIVEQHNLLPQSCFELGIINLETGKLKESKKWLKKAKNDYYGYVTQTLIEYRVRWTLDIIKQKKKLSEQH